MQANQLSIRSAISSIHLAKLPELLDKGCFTALCRGDARVDDAMSVAMVAAFWLGKTEPDKSCFESGE